MKLIRDQVKTIDTGSIFATGGRSQWTRMIRRFTEIEISISDEKAGTLPSISNNNKNNSQSQNKVNTPIFKWDHSQQQTLPTVLTFR